MSIIDTHIHAWNFDKASYDWLKNDTSILNRTYNVDEIENERKEVGITGGVMVQSANNLEDTEWMLEIASNSTWINGVVGWLPLMDPSSTAKLYHEKYSSNKYFKGIRHLIHDESDPKWLLQTPVIESLRFLAKHDIPYDVVGVLPEHIETVLEVAEKVPGLRMEFDHLNQPPSPGTASWDRWSSLMKTAAANKNFFAKISGLGTAVKKEVWSAEDFRPGIEFALEHFGTDRIMCGGDWPVSLLGGSYSKTWAACKQIIDSLLSKEEAAKLYHLNAVNFYKL